MEAIDDRALTSVPAVEPGVVGLGRYGTENLVVTAAQFVAWAVTLSAMQALPIWGRIALLPFFCFMMQGVFSMMHEAFHKNAHRDPRWNAFIGTVGSTLFGTSFTLHRIHHWGHHVRNRSVAEQGEFIHSDETVLRKVSLYYFATLGGLWLGGLLFPLFALFVPYRSVVWLAKDKKLNTYSAAYEQFKPSDWTRMRLEALGAVVFWIGAVQLLRWDLGTLALAYGTFAVSWSSLQWIYHLGTPLDVVEGAYNLRLPTPVRWLFLNFNYNLTHHRRPHLPWQELCAASDHAETQPLWYRWLLMFKPPVRVPADLSFLEKRYF